MIERLVDLAAQDLGLDRVEIRRRNLIAARPVPVPHADRQHLRQRQLPGRAREGARRPSTTTTGSPSATARAPRAGTSASASWPRNERSVFSSTEFWFWFDKPEFTPTSSPESASLQIDPTGNIVVTLHSQSLWGNSPETVVSQVVAEEFDVDPDVDHGDLRRLAARAAGHRAGRLALHRDGLGRRGGRRRRAQGQDQAPRRRTSSRWPRTTSSSATARWACAACPTASSTLAEIALSAYLFRLDLPADMESGLASQSTYDHPLTTLPNADRSDLGIFYPFVGHAWHIAVIEVDPETGKFEFLRYAAVHDAGTIVNPKTLNGQIIGGTVQGLGTALLEEYKYDDQGRVLNENFEYYHLPSSMDAPAMTVDHQETPSPYTPYGIKGAGEGGRMLSPAIMSAAIEDALSPYGVQITSLPITAEQIVEWVATAKEAK